MKPAYAGWYEAGAFLARAGAALWPKGLLGATSAASPD